MVASTLHHEWASPSRVGRALCGPGWWADANANATNNPQGNHDGNTYTQNQCAQTQQGGYAVGVRALRSRRLTLLASKPTCAEVP